MKRIIMLLITSILLFVSAKSASSDTRKFNYGDPMDNYKGVIAYCNGGANMPYPEYKYQCVEYIKRFYNDIYHISLGSVGAADNAFDIWGKRSDFEKYSNGSQTPPVPDDIICYSGSESGHVAIITQVAPDNIKMIEQDVSTTTPWFTAKVNSNNGCKIADRGSLKVQGWLHYKGNKPAPKTSPQSDSQSTTANSQPKTAPKSGSILDDIKTGLGGLFGKIKLPDILNPGPGKAKADSTNRIETPFSKCFHSFYVRRKIFAPNEQRAYGYIGQGTMSDPDFHFRTVLNLVHYGPQDITVFIEFYNTTPSTNEIVFSFTVTGPVNSAKKDVLYDMGMSFESKNWKAGYVHARLQFYQKGTYTITAHDDGHNSHEIQIEIR